MFEDACLNYLIDAEFLIFVLKNSQITSSEELISTLTFTDPSSLYKVCLLTKRLLFSENKSSSFYFSADFCFCKTSLSSFDTGLDSTAILFISVF